MRTWSRVAGALLVLSLVVPDPAGAAPVADRGAVRGIRNGRYAIGDSVMLGAAGALRARGFTVNATVSRQFFTGVELVEDLVDSGRLPRKLVFHLGNNGTVLEGGCTRLVRTIGPRRRVWLVTVKVPRSWQRPNNEVLQACARRYRRAFLIPWSSHARGHPGWFASDGYHLTSSGRSAYASFIDSYV